MVVDLCNKAIHTYDSVDDILIWKIIMKDIPIPEQEITKLLQ
ncbi:HepT-like ribonuclease domain-containing protein [uncultured Flavobacterium sp.]